MKKLIILLLVLLSGALSLPGQNRIVTRGAEPGELYLATYWYGIYGPWGPPYHDTLRTAVFRLTENGRNLAVRYSADAEQVAKPGYIIADATPGVLYNVQHYEKDYYGYTQLWVSFDYGESWVFREERNDIIYYYSGSSNGLIYKGEGGHESINYGLSFEEIDIPMPNYGGVKETGLQPCEFWSTLGSDTYQLTHTMNCRQTYDYIPIDPLYIFGNLSGCFPDVYRGGLPGEVYITSWFPNDETGYGYRASFSADTGRTFRHVYVNEPYIYLNNYFGCNQLLYMSDREPGVYYILNLSEIADSDPQGWHTQLCVDYYRDYGETWVDTYCHDLTKEWGAVGMGGLDTDGGVTLYPNPTGGELKIQDLKFKIEKIRLFDIFGRQVLETAETAFDIGHLPAGIYIVRIKTEKGVMTKRIIKL